jgi:osmoprotectant transport system ATP-binding protein
MGDKIALLDTGRLQQLDTPQNLVENPANEFVDQFLGQHRFQLSLLTRSVKSIIEPASTDRPQPDHLPELRLHPRHSLIQALDLFKKTRADFLPVYQQQIFAGNIKRACLLETISDIFGQTGEEQ